MRKRSRKPKHLKRKKPIDFRHLVVSGVIDLFISVIAAWISKKLF